jgi:hypothetical protein
MNNKGKNLLNKMVKKKADAWGAGYSLTHILQTNSIIIN